MLTQAEIQQMMATHCEVIKTIGPQIQWLESYMTADKVYCIYVAPDAATIRLHAQLGGFPIDSVLEIKQVLESQMHNLWTRNQPPSSGFAEA
jgi:hypothetical protein